MTATTRDEVEPRGPWVFDEEVTAAFDDMLQRSIPQYEQMRDIVFAVAAPHVRAYASIVDLGCARGGALVSFAERFATSNRYFGVDASEPMVRAARERFAQCGDLVSVECADLRTHFPDCGACCVALSVLTLQFIPVNYRARIVQRVYDSLLAGGCFVLVEKVLGASAHIDELLVEQYHAYKRAHGYSAEAVRRKALALEGVLVPATAAANESMLRAAGFDQVECVWRHLNFAGWLAVKRKVSHG